MGSSADADISIIVPCWRGDAVPESVARQWLGSGVVKEILVAAACAKDESQESAAAPTTPVALDSAVRLVRCTRSGRGHQMNEAAALAQGTVLLFQHADTELTGEHLHSLRAAMADDPGLGGGAFRRQFDERHPRLRWLEPWEARRCAAFGPLFGDQSIFVRRAVFETMGGFADVPLMEDVEFTCRLRKQARVTLLGPAICSSARKHLQQGSWRTTLTNAFLLLLYVLGVSPHRLHGWYYRR